MMKALSVLVVALSLLAGVMAAQAASVRAAAIQSQTSAPVLSIDNAAPLLIACDPEGCSCPDC